MAQPDPGIDQIGPHLGNHVVEYPGVLCLRAEEDHVGAGDGDGAVQGLALHERAAEWTRAMEHRRDRAAFGGQWTMPGSQRRMLRLTGPCDRAEQEALTACDELRPWT